VNDRQRERLKSVRVMFYGHRGQTAMAKAVSMTLMNYRNYEVKGRDIPIALAVKLMFLFDISPAWLIHGEGEARIVRRDFAAEFDVARLITKLMKEENHR
jgi:hypothetical protein